jgi:hypothetical protein
LPLSAVYSWSEVQCRVATVPEPFRLTAQSAPTKVRVPTTFPAWRVCVEVSSPLLQNQMFWFT